MQNSKHFNQNLCWKNIKWLDSQWIWFWIFEILIINIAISYISWMSSNFIEVLASLFLTKLNSSMRKCTVQVWGWRHHRFLRFLFLLQNHAITIFKPFLSWVCWRESWQIGIIPIPVWTKTEIPDGCATNDQPDNANHCHDIHQTISANIS